MSVMKGWPVLILFLCAGLTACGEKAAPAPTMPLPVILPDHYQWLKPDKVVELQSSTPDLGILDVRNEAEMRDGNGWLLGAQPCSFFDGGEAKLTELDRNRPWLVYCTLGGRSERVAKTMASLGFKQVYLLKGGFIEWLAEKKPVVK